MSVTDLRYFDLSSGPSPRLQLVTPKGVLREVPLTERDLLKIIRSAADALEVLARERDSS